MREYFNTSKLAKKLLQEEEFNWRVMDRTKSRYKIQRIGDGLHRKENIVYYVIRNIIREDLAYLEWSINDNKIRLIPAEPTSQVINFIYQMAFKKEIQSEVAKYPLTPNDAYNIKPIKP